MLRRVALFDHHSTWWRYQVATSHSLHSDFAELPIRRPPHHLGISPILVSLHHVLYGCSHRLSQCSVKNARFSYPAIRMPTSAARLLLRLLLAVVLYNEWTVALTSYFGPSLIANWCFHWPFWLLFCMTWFLLCFFFFFWVRSWHTSVRNRLSIRCHGVCYWWRH